MVSIPINQGQLEFHQGFYSAEEASFLLLKLKEEITFESHSIRMFGKIIPEPRLISWHGDSHLTYTYSKKQMTPKAWTPSLLSCKSKLETITGYTFNNVLLNLYRNGADHMGWHADDEKELGKNPVIASISLGDERFFHLKHRYNLNEPIIKLPLTHGSLLMMGGEMQHFWKHRIPPSRKSQLERLNLTFRFITN